MDHLVHHGLAEYIEKMLTVIHYSFTRHTQHSENCGRVVKAVNFEQTRAQQYENSNMDV